MMLPFAIPATVKRLWPLALVAVVIGILLLTYCEGKDAGTAEADRSRLEGNVKAERDKGAADTNAAETRLEDVQRANSEQTELKEAVNEAPDDPASRRAAYYACLSRLQQARREGRDPVAAGC